MSDQNNTGFGLGEIGQISIPVGNLDRAIAFYRNVLGMHFLFQAPPSLAFFDCNGVRLLLDVPAKRTAETHGSVIYYKVPGTFPLYFCACF